MTATFESKLANLPGHSHPAKLHGSWPTLSPDNQWFVFDLAGTTPWPLEWEGEDDERLDELENKLSDSLVRLRYATSPDHMWACAPLDVRAELSFSHECDCEHCPSPRWPADQDEVTLTLHFEWVRAPGADASNAVWFALGLINETMTAFFEGEP